MSIYFVSKSRFVTGMVSCRPSVQNQWNVTSGVQRQSKLFKSTQENNTHNNQQQQHPTGLTGGGGGGKQKSTSGLRGHQQESQQQQQQGGHEGGRKGNDTLHRFRKSRKSWRWKAGASWTILSVLDWWLLAAGGWLTWRGVFLKWTPLGICIIAAVQWQRGRVQDSDRSGKQLLPRTASQWQTSLYCSLPLRAMSRGWGWLADCRVPIPLRPVVYGCYSTAFGVNLSEAATPDFKSYRSLAEFFARSLKENARLIDASSCLVSPADGKVLYFGKATNEQVEQVKGVTYSLKSFLGPANWVPDVSMQYSESLRLNQKEETDLYQCIIYLAPGDYHRFHSPTNWQPELRRHFTGELLSVSPVVAQWIPGLFCLNERALYIGKWLHGFFSFTAVGATNVGSVQIYIDEQLKTNQWCGMKMGKTNTDAEYDELTLPADTMLAKGEMIGQFNMGSTVVLIFEAPKDFRFYVRPGQKVKMGEPLGCVKEINSSPPEIVAV